jgi:hypothetical protein
VCELERTVGSNEWQVGPRLHACDIYLWVRAIGSLWLRRPGANDWAHYGVRSSLIDLSRCLRDFIELAWRKCTAVLTGACNVCLQFCDSTMFLFTWMHGFEDQEHCCIVTFQRNQHNRCVYRLRYSAVTVVHLITLAKSVPVLRAFLCIDPTVKVGWNNWFSRSCCREPYTA